MTNSKIKKIFKLILPPLLLLPYKKYKALNSNNNSNRLFEKLIRKNKKYKNFLANQKIFILGSGPSVLSQNLESLKNENLIFLNNFHTHKSYDSLKDGNGVKFHLLAPFHPPQEKSEWRRLLQSLSKKKTESMKYIFGLSNYQNNIASLLQEDKNISFSEIIWFQIKELFKGPPEADFEKMSLDLASPIDASAAASVYAIVCAMYFGCSEVYLVGMDHNYVLYDNETEMRFYKSAPHQKDEIKRTFGNYFHTKEFLRQYYIFAYYEVLSKNRDTQIFNCSDKSLAKMFPYRDFPNAK